MQGSLEEVEGSPMVVAVEGNLAWTALKAHSNSTQQEIKGRLSVVQFLQSCQGIKAGRLHLDQ